MPDDGYNWFLIIVAIVCSVVVTMINVYILVHFQHPEDRNQAWFPKLVVVRARGEATSRARAPLGASVDPPPLFFKDRKRSTIVS
jgi:hypothetical protein